MLITDKCFNYDCIYHKNYSIFHLSTIIQIILEVPYKDILYLQHHIHKTCIRKYRLKYWMTLKKGACLGNKCIFGLKQQTSEYFTKYF